MRRALIACAVLAIAIAVAGGAHAARKGRSVDALWTHPDYAGMGVDRIALIPVASFDNNLQNENLVEALLGQTLKDTGYRWISGTSTRDMLRARGGGDSLLKVVKAQILERGRVDSLQAQSLCAMLACDGLLAMRIDQWEQWEPEWNQSGKPTTTVKLSGALVDSLGRLAWSAAGGNTAEGPYYDPNTNPTSVKDSGLGRKPVSSQGGAPSFRETLATLLRRWAPLFPPGPQATPAPAGGKADGGTR